MRLSQVHPGMQYGRVKILAVKRIRAHTEVTYTDGRTQRTVLLHKTQSLQTVLEGPLASMSLDRRTMERPRHRPHASNPEWRGETSGHRGERFIARTGMTDLYSRSDPLIDRSTKPRA